MAISSKARFGLLKLLLFFIIIAKDTVLTKIVKNNVFHAKKFYSKIYCQNFVIKVSIVFV